MLTTTSNLVSNSGRSKSFSRGYASYLLLAASAREPITDINIPDPVPFREWDAVQKRTGRDYSRETILHSQRNIGGNVRQFDNGSYRDIFCGIFYSLTYLAIGLDSIEEKSGPSLTHQKDWVSYLGILTAKE